MGILCDHIITTNLLVLLLKTKSIMTAFLLVIGIVREALAVVVKRWTPVLFSCRILLLNNVVAAAQQRLMKLPNMDMANRSRSAFDPYYSNNRHRANGTVATNEKALVVKAAKTSDGTPQFC